MTKAARARAEFLLGFFETFRNVNRFVVENLQVVVDLWVTCLSGSTSVILNPRVEIRFRTFATVTQNRRFVQDDWRRINSIKIIKNSYFLLVNFFRSYKMIWKKQNSKIFYKITLKHCHKIILTHPHWECDVK